MSNTLKTLSVAAAFAIAAPAASFAATITGTVNLSGGYETSTADFSTTGSVDLNDIGYVSTDSTDDLSTVATGGTSVDLTDIDFSAPGELWSVGGFTFTATSFSNITSSDSSDLFGFSALGFVTGTGFDTTVASFSFSAQTVGGFGSFSSTTTIPAGSTVTLPAVPLPAGFLLMGSALAGFGMVRRKKA